MCPYYIRYGFGKDQVASGIKMYSIGTGSLYIAAGIQENSATFFGELAVNGFKFP